MHKTLKILFLLKSNSGYSDNPTPVSKSGLFNSATITAQEISQHLDVDTRVRICADANSIDKEVRAYKPDLCIIEAVWVLPEKFEELRKIYPTLPFIVRIHSEIPFLSHEGEAVGRIFKYVKIPSVYVAFNSLNTFKNFTYLGNKLYLPNVYSDIRKHFISISEELDFIWNKKKFKVPYPGYTYDIASFGAIRPLKNQLLQAFAAVAFGNKNNVKVRFHINSTRIEQGGESPLKNIRSLFEAFPRHQLVEHAWEKRRDFLNSVSQMDLGLQLSFNESFNIVSADFVKERIPIITSSAVGWLPKEAQIDTDLVSEIVKKIETVLANRSYIVKKSGNALAYYNKQALKDWKDIL